MANNRVCGVGTVFQDLAVYIGERVTACDYPIDHITAMNGVVATRMDPARERSANRAIRAPSPNP